MLESFSSKFKTRKPSNFDREKEKTKQKDMRRNLRLQKMEEEDIMFDTK